MPLDDFPDELLSDLPDWDGSSHSSEFYDPDDAELEAVSEVAQRRAMMKWFLARYCDPAQETPYESREGGYIWINGGPYDPGEQLTDRFSHVVDQVLAAV